MDLQDEQEWDSLPDSQAGQQYAGSSGPTRWASNSFERPECDAFASITPPGVHAPVYEEGKLEDTDEPSQDALNIVDMLLMDTQAPASGSSAKSSWCSISPAFVDTDLQDLDRPASDLFTETSSGGQADWPLSTSDNALGFEQDGQMSTFHDDLESGPDEIQRHVLQAEGALPAGNVYDVLSMRSMLCQIYEDICPALEDDSGCLTSTFQPIHHCKTASFAEEETLYEFPMDGLLSSDSEGASTEWPPNGDPWIVEVGNRKDIDCSKFHLVEEDFTQVNPSKSESLMSWSPGGDGLERLGHE
eukprot:SM000255S08758  [mRNA]  locus=s255:86944:87959:+ [translate_table: standard]